MSIVRISKGTDKKLGACVANSIAYITQNCNSKNLGFYIAILLLISRRKYIL